MERQWAENINKISCIPPGTYECVKRDRWKRSDKWGYTYQVQDVPDRTGILFHPAIWPSQLEGCISMGQYMMDYKDRMGIMQSSSTFEKMIKKLRGVLRFVLTIIEVR